MRTGISIKKGIFVRFFAAMAFGAQNVNKKAKRALDIGESLWYYISVANSRCEARSNKAKLNMEGYIGRADEPRSVFAHLR